MKLILTEKSKFQRLEWVLSRIKNDGLVFDDMYQQIHVNGKWFYQQTHKRKIHILPGKAPPQPKAKQYIQKVMFLCAVV